MRWVDFGVEPVGVIAIGANATGVIAIGQLATGVIAVGQLARGGIVLGQLALGLVTVGQLSVGVAWAAGQIGIGGTAGPLLVYGAFGRLHPKRLLGKEPGPVMEESPGELSPARRGLGLVLLTILLAVWWVGAGMWVADALGREGGVFFDPDPEPIFR